MKRPLADIEDSEIRVISPSGARKTNGHYKYDDVKTADVPKGRHRWLIVSVITLSLVLVVGVICFITAHSGDEMERPAAADVAEQATSLSTRVDETDRAHVEVLDTIVHGTRLKFLFPHNVVPVLALGEETLADTTALLVVQAADIRADNGRIAGSFVLAGDLIGKGEAKAGFCAIIDGRVSLGVSDATPMFEQAIAGDGYFFRQYPLVVGGQVVENKPKGTSYRKALVDVDGHIAVAMSEEKLTFHDFSEALIDAGVRNAIYLVGSTSPGFYRDDSGRVVRFGKEENNKMEYVNFMVWK